MSANRWVHCPVCQRKMETARAEAYQQVLEKYGKLSAEDYTQQLHEAEQLPTKVPTASLREDYEIGIDGESLVMTYSCRCARCGAKYEYCFAIDDVFAGMDNKAPKGKTERKAKHATTR